MYCGLEEKSLSLCFNICVEGVFGDIIRMLFVILYIQMKVDLGIVVVVMVLATLNSVQGMPNGAPFAACEDLTPQHGTDGPTIAPSPYTILTDPFNTSSDNLYYTPGQTYTRERLNHQIYSGTSLSLSISLYQDNSINRTLSSVLNVTFVYLTTSEMRTPHYSGHFNLTQ